MTGDEHYRYRQHDPKVSTAFHGLPSRGRCQSKVQILDAHGAALLHEALASLIRQKPYDEIVVREILDRANVGRSTFYTHFRDKDELLASGIPEMLRGVHAAESPASEKRHERVVHFGLAVFEHIHRHREAGAGGMGARGRAIIHEHLQRVVAQQIADAIGKVSELVGRNQQPPQPEGG
jgi:AcrR family transcriptional regulator